MIVSPESSVRHSSSCSISGGAVRVDQAGFGNLNSFIEAAGGIFADRRSALRHECSFTASANEWIIGISPDLLLAKRSRGSNGRKDNSKAGSCAQNFELLSCAVVLVLRRCVIHCRRQGHHICRRHFHKSPELHRPMPNQIQNPLYAPHRKHRRDHQNHPEDDPAQA